MDTQGRRLFFKVRWILELNIESPLAIYKHIIAGQFIAEMVPLLHGGGVLILALFCIVDLAEAANALYVFGDAFGVLETGLAPLLELLHNLF